MKKKIGFIILLSCLSITFAVCAFAQEATDVVEQDNPFFTLLSAFGPMLLFIVLLIFFLKKSQRQQGQYFEKILPEYTKKHMEHMDSLIERLDKLIQILERKKPGSNLD